MVIIKRDDHISYINSTGVIKMPITPANDNISSQPPGNGGTTIPPINNISQQMNQTAAISTIKRDSSLQQLQQLQQYTQQQSQELSSLSPTLVKAQLICRPNSHPFPSRTLLLEPKKPMKIGRAIARTKASDNNAIFDCKVLSRNHAELWYDDGKFFLKDTGSSNGTFINNTRLSQTCQTSEPFEVSSGDIVQFGVDVMENSRKETHGCIVATLKLFLPDGRETKASQSTLAGASNTKIPQVDLYRLNQYIQEAIQREQSLESKLLNIQKKIDLVRSASSASWQALVDEDRLLSRIDMLEKKLLCFSKTLTEDKLREEIMKLQNEKMLYQTSAKQALKKVYNERMEAIQKLSTLENALCSTEDECSLLRDQLDKTQTHSQEATQRLDAIQTQMDVKVNDYEEKMYKKETELKSLNSELNDLQDKLGSFKLQNEIGDYENSQLVTNWLLKSDIKNIDGSDDIIKAICADDVTIKDEESILLAPTITSSQETLQQQQPCDDNQNNMNNRMISNVNVADVTSEKIRVNLKQLLALYAKLKRQLVEFMEAKANEQSSYKAKCDEMSSELMALKLELESRPTLEDFDGKNQQCNDLRLELSNLTEQMSLNEKLLEQHQKELIEARKNRFDEMKHLEEREMQTEAVSESTKELSEVVAQDECNTSSSSSVLSQESLSSVRIANSQTKSSIKIPQSIEVPDGVQQNVNNDDNDDDDDDDTLNNHPKVLYEDELIVFKEKCTNLTAENVRLLLEVRELRTNISHFHNSWLHNFVLKYIVPVMIVFVAYIFYLLK
ncbi:CLUMA_CG019598, isoform A [Clunio marinus]|uniref:CLUMA_CG019598, isoform A n=1 Tax=Clunio marinus TaxID=568069 RepID=A0A1J1J2U4_9DIPT|nr:CLUMA_CG019598, isoform A [Clunio marinus]